MAIDASIYGLLDTKGLQKGLAGIGEAYAAQQERKNRLAQLAQQQELGGLQLEQQKEAMTPEAVAYRKTKLANEQTVLQSNILNQALKPVAMGNTSDEALTQARADALRQGVPQDAVDMHFAQIASSQDPIQRQNIAKSHVYKIEDWQKEQENALKRQAEKEKFQAEIEGRKDVARQHAETMAALKAPSAEPPPKAAPGTRVYQENGEWKTEVLKGSPQWQNLKSKEATDRAFTQNIVPTFDKNADQINELINHPGFENIFGRLGSIESLDVKADTRNARSKLAQITGAMETAGMQLQKSTAGSAGSMSEREWPKMQTYLNVVKTTSDPTEAKEALKRAAEVYERMRNIALESYQNEWAGGQFGDQSVVERLKGGKSGGFTPPQGWTLHTDARGNKAYVSPDGKQFQEVK